MTKGNIIKLNFYNALQFSIKFNSAGLIHFLTARFLELNQSDENFISLDDHSGITREVISDALICNGEKNLAGFNDATETDLKRAQAKAESAEEFIRKNFEPFLRDITQAFILTSLYESNRKDMKKIHQDVLREMSRKVEEGLQKWVFNPGPGGNTRDRIWTDKLLKEFAKKVDERSELAKYLKKYFESNGTDSEWVECLKKSNKYKQLAFNCNEKALDEVLKLISQRLNPEYWNSLLKENSLFADLNTFRRHHYISNGFPSVSKLKRLLTPKAFACELAVRELNITRSEGEDYKVETLLKKYQKARKLERES